VCPYLISPLELAQQSEETHGERETGITFAHFLLSLLSSPLLSSPLLSLGELKASKQASKQADS
jgi:hypothetical protein